MKTIEIELPEVRLDTELDVIAGYLEANYGIGKGYFKDVGQDMVSRQVVSGLCAALNLSAQDVCKKFGLSLYSYYTYKDTRKLPQYLRVCIARDLKNIKEIFRVKFRHRKNGNRWQD